MHLIWVPSALLQYSMCACMKDEVQRDCAFLCGVAEDLEGFSPPKILLSRS